jgi:probable HAF family extracellular repeat protein
MVQKPHASASSARRCAFLVVLVLGLAAGSTIPAAASTFAYTMTDLGTLGFDTYGLAINATGQITGYSYSSNEVQYPCPKSPDYPTPKKCFEPPNHAFLWSNGTMKDLGTLGGDFSEGVAINGSGEVVGWAQTKAGYADQFLWNGKTMVDLGNWNGNATDINDAGQISGTCGTAPGQHACLFSNGTLTQLPNPTTFTPFNCAGSAINKTGQVVGGCDDASSNLHAVLWQNGMATDLGTLGGSAANATAINNIGQVVGWAGTSAGASHGFLYSNGRMTDLGFSWVPAAINDSGVIVGSDMIYRNGTVQNLNTLIPPGSGFTLANAAGINNNGQIVVDGYNAQGFYHTFLLTPS